MEQFNLSNYLAECVKYSPKPFDIEGIPFNLIMLDDELIDNVQNRETHEEMLFAAATYGLSAGSERAANCSELKERMKTIWEMEELSVDCNPSLRHKVGIVVCELSGLTDFINAQKAKEDADAEVALNLAIEKEEAEAKEKLAKESRDYLAKTDGVIDGDELPNLNLTPEQLAEDALNNATA